MDSWNTWRQSCGRWNYFLWSKGLWDLWCCLLGLGSADHRDPLAEDSSSLSSPDSNSSSTAWNSGLGRSASLLPGPTCSSWLVFLGYRTWHGFPPLGKLFIGIISCVSRLSWSVPVRECALNMMDGSSESLLSLPGKIWQEEERTWLKIREKTPYLDRKNSEGNRVLLEVPALTLTCLTFPAPKRAQNRSICAVV